ncbi:MAG: GIY-YIG nuclease family protein [Bacteroidota bacterium]|nr:GIY-YIG nuclease family protein [Bacteroidota bacterium]MDX5506967.1 GIY-YIG nuclease family protein [Bacteroidota bacterium]
MSSWVYILECSDGSLYTGCTKDIERRVLEHQNGVGSLHTKRRRPLDLVYMEEFQCIKDAIAREKQIHGWSRRKKWALINGDLQSLKRFSKSGGKPE